MSHTLMNDRISQLPMAMFGIVHDVAYNGISMSIFADTDVQKCEATLLP
ncbi:hypothetical protein LOK74_21105 [Brevibacillus humidisoli]|nr:RAxF-45 family protein [Brevibacillus humidisoli]UFJ40498.1 hypothetical protein LOK74_21105 [Brevibacillus humidisoli]